MNDAAKNLLNDALLPEFRQDELLALLRSYRVSPQDVLSRCWELQHQDGLDFFLTNRAFTNIVPTEHSPCVSLANKALADPRELTSWALSQLQIHETDPVFWSAMHRRDARGVGLFLKKFNGFGEGMRRIDYSGYRPDPLEWALRHDAFDVVDALLPYCTGPDYDFEKIKTVASSIFTSGSAKSIEKLLTFFDPKADHSRAFYLVAHRDDAPALLKFLANHCDPDEGVAEYTRMVLRQHDGSLIFYSRDDRLRRLEKMLPYVSDDGIVNIHLLCPALGEVDFFAQRLSSIWGQQSDRRTAPVKKM